MKPYIDNDYIENHLQTEYEQLYIDKCNVEANELQWMSDVDYGGLIPYQEAINRILDEREWVLLDGQMKSIIEMFNTFGIDFPDTKAMRDARKYLDSRWMQYVDGFGSIGA